jgi:Putative phage abortive infection protein
MSESKIKTTKFGKTLFVSTAAVIIIVWAASGYFIHNYLDLILKDAQPGTFGDMFGAVNALFSGLAFACLIFATLMQRQELSLQREELKLAREEAAKTREEIKGQKDQATIQNEGFKRQRFENTFFEMLKLNHQIVERIKHPSFHPGYEGRMLFVGCTQNLSAGHEKEEGKDIISQVQTTLNHYYGNIFQIMTLVKNEFSATQGEKNESDKYSKILQAQLSDAELTVLFYKCFWDKDVNFRELAKSLRLFDSLPDSGLLDVSHRAQL